MKLYTICVAVLFCHGFPTFLQADDACLNLDDTCNDEAKEAAIVNQLQRLANTPPKELGDFYLLHNLVEQLRKRQRVHPFFKKTLEDRQKLLPALNTWCKDKMFGLKIVSDPKFGFGMQVTRNIQAGALLISVNINQTFTAASAKKKLARFANALKYVKQSVAAEEAFIWEHHAWLSLSIASERLRLDSPWKPYLDMLPNRLDSAFYFGPAELSVLRGSQCYDDIVMLYKTTVKQYAQIYGYLNKEPHCCLDLHIKPEKFSFDLYRWGIAIGYTRSYSDGENHVLIPCFDMVNHGKHQMNTELAYETTSNRKRPTAARSTAVVHLRANSQLSYTYVPEYSTMNTFFENWGIINPKGTLVIKFKLHSSDALYRTKRAALYKATVQRNPLSRPIAIFQNDFEVDQIPLHPSDYKFLMRFSVGKSHKKATHRDWTSAWVYLIRQLRHYSSKYRYKLPEAKSMLHNPVGFSEQTILSLREIIAEQEAIERTLLWCVKLSKDKNHLQFESLKNG